MSVQEINGRLSVTIEVDGDGYFDVRNAALYLGRTSSYIKVLARKGTIDFIEGAEGEMLFHRDALDAYAASPKRGGRRAGAVPYTTLSSVGRKLRSVILMVSRSEADEADREVTTRVLQTLLDASVASNDA